MCECGCFGSAGRFRLKAPRGYYMITLSPPCRDCDIGAGIAIDIVDAAEAKEYAGPLEIGSNGVLIKCGPRRDEFVAAMKDHLSGLSDGDGKELGDDGAEVYAEEAWDGAVEDLMVPTVVVIQDATEEGAKP